MKGDISDTVIGSVAGQGSRKFNHEELRELFTLNINTDCDTQDVLLKNGAQEWQVHTFCQADSLHVNYLTSTAQ